MKSTTNGSIDIASVRSRFRAVRDGLHVVFREREDAIECMTLAALSGSHALLVGPPGTAKSALFFGFLASFPDARKFQTLVTKFGTEDEYFGPVKLSSSSSSVVARTRALASSIRKPGCSLPRLCRTPRNPVGWRGVLKNPGT